MKNKPIILLSIFVAFLILSCLFGSCKNNPVVQPQQQTNQNPTAPTLTSPQNETTTRQLQPYMIWQAFENAVSYRIQISLDANFGGIMLTDSNGITGTQIQVPAGKLHTAVFYYWRVRANLPNNATSNWSAVWRFNIVLNAPGAPNLISPPNNAVNVPFLPLFQWSQVDSADFYRIQISLSSNFGTILFDSNRIASNQFQMPIFYINTGTQYYWRANASNSDGVSTSPWSSVFNFTTVSGPRPNSINGRITFVDSNFVHLPFTYTVFALTSWPPSGNASPNDSLIIHKVGNNYIADYTIPYLINGNYFVLVIGSGSQFATQYIMGIYGCDTVHVQYSNCPNDPVTAPVQNNNGTLNINFLSWADTTYKIF